MLRRLLLILLSLMLAGLSLAGSCSNQQSGQVDLKASQYNVACQVDDDCMAIRAGNICDGCSCDFAAIAKTDLVAYDNDLQQANCSPDKLCSCRPGRPVCLQRQCTLVK